MNKIAFEKHNKKDYDEICPKCGSDEEIEKIIGWCYNHNSPDLETNGLFYCDHDHSESFVSKMRGAFFCHKCNSMYDKEKIVDWEKYEFHNCPVGEEYDETVKEFTASLLHLLSEYDEDKIDECLSKNFYIEAIVYLHRHVFEQLRYLLIKKIKGAENIPLNEEDRRFKEIVPFIKNMADSTLLRRGLMKKKKGTLQD